MRTLLSLVVLFQVSAASFAQLDFKPGVYTDGWDRPRNIAVGDFDGDGKDDFAVGRTSASDIVVYYSKGNNEFTKKKLAATSILSGTVEVGAGDFNNDGKDDLIVYENFNTAQSSWKVTVCLSTGTDFTKKAVGLPVQSPNWRFQLFDMDSDGKLDIVHADRAQPLRYLKGDGAGNFSAVAMLDLTLPTNSESFSTFKFRVADLNNDHRPDVVTMLRDYFAVYLKNPGTGYTKTELSLTGEPANVMAADFSDDGVPDVVAVTRVFVTSNYQYSLKYFVNNGQGGLATPIELSTSRLSETLIHFDYNNDGLEDILTGSTVSNEVMFLFRNLGGNSFEEKSPGFNPGRSITDVAAGNFEGAGTEKIVASSFDGIIEVYNYNGVEYVQGVEMLSTVACTVGETFDLDKDGNMDIVGTAGTAAAIWYGKGNSEYEDPILYKTYSSSQGIVVADFNNDDFGDIVFGNRYLRSTGPRTYTLTTLPYGGSVAIVAGDINNDGKIDIATSNGSFINNGAGNFTLQSYSTLSSANSGALIHYNDDAFPDLALSENRKLYVSLNNGSGVFGAPTEVSLTGNIGITIKAVDLNGDAYEDLVASTTSAGTGAITLLKRDAPNHFEETRISHASNAINGTADVRDMNNDGIPDIVANYSANENTGITVYLGQPPGYQAAMTFKSTNASNQQLVLGGNAIDVGDMNKDGLLDVVIFSLNGVSASVLLNDFVKEPVTASTSLTITDVTTTTAKASFQKGSGSGRIVLVRRNADTNISPLDNTFYEANSKYSEAGLVGTDSRAVMSSNETSVAITDLLPGQKYAISVFEYQTNSDNTIINYSPAHVTTTFNTVVDPTTAVEDTWSSFTLHPNPASSVVSVTFPPGFTMTGEPMVFNAVGSAFQVKTTSVHNGIEMNTTDLTPGLYFIRLSGEKSVTLKMLKQ